jgi:hypothetical protein
MLRAACVWLAYIPVSSAVAWDNRRLNMARRYRV